MWRVGNQLQQTGTVVEASCQHIISGHTWNPLAPVSAIANINKIIGTSLPASAGVQRDR
jgi:hypothetical protein